MQLYPRLPSLNALKTFDAAAKLSSFKSAADELNVTPTAVSHQIKTLEEALGTLLFERKVRAVALTEEGRLLAGTTGKIFQQLSATITEITDTAEMLTISTTSSLASMWLVPNLSKFNQTHPEIVVSIKTGEQMDDLDNDRRLDLAIRYGKYDPSRPETSKLVTENFGIFATPSYLEKVGDLEEAQFLETKWVNPSIPAVNWDTVSELNGGKLTIPQRQRTQFDQEVHVIQAALAGQGIALVSSLLVRNPLHQKWLVPVPHSDLPEKIEGLTYYLYVPGRNHRNKAVTAFIQWLKSEMRQQFSERF